MCREPLWQPLGPRLPVVLVGHMTPSACGMNSPGEELNGFFQLLPRVKLERKTADFNE